MLTPMEISPALGACEGGPRSFGPPLIVKSAARQRLPQAAGLARKGQPGSEEVSAIASTPTSTPPTDILSPAPLLVSGD